jgi:hypothetical protein
MTPLCVNGTRYFSVLILPAGNVSRRGKINLMHIKPVDAAVRGVVNPDA